MKRGVILAGGLGTRLLPATKIINKHLIPILNVPMILYPLETLKKFGITEILIVSGGDHIGGFADFLGTGSAYGVDLTYKAQEKAGGIAEALGLAKEFVGNEKNFMVVLGDNIFSDDLLSDVIIDYSQHIDSFLPINAHLFTKKVARPERFGVLCQEGNKKWIEEKPKEPKSKEAVTGLYVYPNDVFDIIPTLSPSARGELEITSVNNHYIEKGGCIIHEVNGFWSDAGTRESLAEVTKWAIENNK